MSTDKQIESHAGTYAFLLVFGTAILALFLLGLAQWCDKNYSAYPVTPITGQDQYFGVDNQ